MFPNASCVFFVFVRAIFTMFLACYIFLFLCIFWCFATNTHTKQTTHSRHHTHNRQHSNAILESGLSKTNVSGLERWSTQSLKGKYQEKLWCKLQAVASVSGQAKVVGDLAGMSLKGGAKMPEVAKLLCENSGADVEWLLGKFSLDLSLVAQHSPW